MIQEKKTRRRIGRIPFTFSIVKTNKKKTYKEKKRAEINKKINKFQKKNERKME